MILVSLGFGLLIGLLLGLMGGGGSILAVPVFVYVMEYSPKTAISMSLAVVGATSLVGGIRYWQKNQVDLRVAFIFGIVAMLGAYIGARLAYYFTDTAQMILFAFTMLAASYFMFTNKNSSLEESPNAEEKAQSFIVLGLEGMFVGILSGLVGVGGGFLIVPALVIFGKLPMKQAVGTSLIIISMKSVTGFMGYLGQTTIPWKFMTIFTVAAIVGIFIGSYCVKFISQQMLKKSFAVFVFLMGLFVFFTNF